jgi:hypothetical protein
VFDVTKYGKLNFKFRDPDPDPNLKVRTLAKYGSATLLLTIYPWISWQSSQIHFRYQIKRQKLTMKLSDIEFGIRTIGRILFQKRKRDLLHWSSFV